MITFIIAVALAGYIFAGVSIFRHFFRNGPERMKVAGFHAFYTSFACVTFALGYDLAGNKGIPYILFFLLMSNGLFIAVMKRWKIEGIAALLSPLSIIALIVQLAFPGKDYLAASRLPSSPWLYLHIIAFLFSYACFTLAAFCSIIYLYQAKRLKMKRLDEAFLRLPPLKVLDIASYRFMGLGFPLLAMGIYFGSLWSHVHLGTYWTLRPGSITAIIITALYLICIHTRMISRWQGVRINIMLVAAFVLMLAAILGVGHIPF